MDSFLAISRGLFSKAELFLELESGVLALPGEGDFAGIALFAATPAAAHAANPPLFSAAATTLTTAATAPRRRRSPLPALLPSPRWNWCKILLAYCTTDAVFFLSE